MAIKRPLSKEIRISIRRKELASNSNSINTEGLASWVLEKMTIEEYRDSALLSMATRQVESEMEGESRKRKSSRGVRLFFLRFITE